MTRVPTISKDSGFVDAAPAAGQKNREYPGIPTTCDGSEAVVHVEVNVTQASGAYPITISTNMGGGYNAAVSNGYRNLWGEPLVFVEIGRAHV